MQKMQEFRFGALWFDQGTRHPKFLGAFNKAGVLIAAQLADGSIHWRRHCDEAPEGFEKRVTNDLLDLMCLALCSSFDSAQSVTGGGLVD
ncbi:MAG: hypothetical protein ACR652_25100 [Methylocystis sp.]|uniref:hypothetical protein n=1 Tax=Methylocystis sp. TaxID=1911079 RepID=UPI003DA28136